MLRRWCRGREWSFGSAGVWRVQALLAVVLVATACASREARFDAQNARAHVERLAGAIGSRPAGSTANQEARAYLIETLQLYGFDVRVQEADATWIEGGRTARVANLIAIKPGESREAIGLVAHYDSVTAGPGAGDDGFGVATALEAARVLAARPAPQYSLMVLLTDAEEDGLMGARALVEDAEVRGRLRTYLNLEAIGTRGPVPLFETGPGTGPALRAWAEAPQPRGGSYMLAVYKALPNDTDATVLSTLGVYGLNFAAVGDSHVYHTDRDRPDRVTSRALATLGDNVVAIVERLDAGPLDATDQPSVYFSVFDRTAFILSRTAARALAVVAVLLGVLGAVALLRHLGRTAGWLAVLVSYAWATIATGAVALALFGAVWLLRVARVQLHPWHASPWRLFLFMTVMVVAMTWAVRRVASVLPSRLRPIGTPAAVWAAALPVWVVLAVLASLYADTAAYLVAVPLAIAGLLVPLGAGKPGIARTASLVVAAVVWGMLATDAWALLSFAVAVLARLPVVTPTWLFPALFMALGVLLWPPVLAVLVGRPSWRLRHGLAGSVLALAVVVSAVLVLLAPAYTAERPQRRTAVHVDDRTAGRASWKLASNEPGVDIGQGPANVQWRPLTDEGHDPWRPAGAFVFEGDVPPPTTAPPATVTARVVRRDDTADVEIAVGPHDLERMSVAFVLPEAVVPTFSTLPGRTRGERWQAQHVNVPRDGLVWRATLPASQADAMAGAEVWLSQPDLPGAEPPARVPSWLPRERTAWATAAVTILPVVPDEREATETPLGASRFAPTPLGRVHYFDSGTGTDALVFLHGWGGRAEIWREQQALATGRRALYLDLPGHGRSDVGDGPYTVAAVAEAVDTTLQSAGLTRAVVVGHSLGALVGWHVAMRAPARVEALVSVDGVLLPPVATQEDARQFTADLDPSDMGRFREGLLPRLFTAQSPPALRDEVASTMAATSPRVLAELMTDLVVPGGPPFTPGTLTRPVLALEATSTTTSPREGESRLRAQFPTLDFRAFPGAGHYLMLERPREVNDAIAGFLLGRGLLR